MKNETKTYSVIPILRPLNSTYGSKFTIDTVIHDNELCDVYTVNEDLEKVEIGTQDPTLNVYGRKYVPYSECQILVYIKLTLDKEQVFPVILSKHTDKSEVLYANCKTKKEYLEKISQGFSVEVGVVEGPDSQIIFTNSLINKQVQILIEYKRGNYYSYRLDEEWLEKNKIGHEMEEDEEDEKKELEEIENKQRWIEQRKDIYSLIIKSKSLEQFVIELDEFVKENEFNKSENEYSKSGKLNLVF